MGLEEVQGAGSQSLCPCEGHEIEVVVEAIIRTEGIVNYCKMHEFSIEIETNFQKNEFRRKKSGLKSKDEKNMGRLKKS